MIGLRKWISDQLCFNFQSEAEGETKTEAPTIIVPAVASKCRNVIMVFAAVEEWVNILY